MTAPVPPPPPAAPKSSLWRSLRAVLWALLGVRKRSGYEQDMHQLNPLHVLLVAVVLVFLLVIGLIFLAKLAGA